MGCRWVPQGTGPAVASAAPARLRAGAAAGGRTGGMARTRYTSGWFTVVLPTVGFLLLWVGPVLLVLALLGWSAPWWLVALLVVLGIPASLAACVWTYQLLLRLAERGSGELRVEGNRIRWRTGARWRRVDLSRPYTAGIAAGTSGLARPNASVSFTETGLLIHLRGGRREEVLAAFPQPYFVEELAVTPEEGLWGFELDAQDPGDVARFLELVEALWRTRGANRRYATFCRFPWDTPPRPAFTHIEVLEPGQGGEPRRLLERVRAQVVSSPTPWLAATPDYLVGSEPSPWDDLVGREARWFLMPLGHVRAEETLPRPDLGPFLLGRFVITALGGRASAIPLQHRRFLRVHGHDRSGAPLVVAFEWLEPADEAWTEARYFVRFVNRPA